MNLTLGGFLATVALVGCTSRAVDERAAKDVADLHVNAAGAFLTVGCRDGSAFGPSCGLVTEHVATAEFRTLFRDKKCVGLGDAACQAAYQQALDTWMRQRYNAADFAQVARLCDPTPHECVGTKYELRLLESHNRETSEAVIAAEVDIDDRRAAEQRRRVDDQWDTAAGIAGEIIYLTHDGPTCQSYPSIFSGVTNTICSR